MKIVSVATAFAALIISVPALAGNFTNPPSTTIDAGVQAYQTVVANGKHPAISGIQQYRGSQVAANSSPRSAQISFGEESGTGILNGTAKQGFVAGRTVNVSEVHTRTNPYTASSSTKAGSAATATASGKDAFADAKAISEALGASFTFN